SLIIIHHNIHYSNNEQNRGVLYQSNGYSTYSFIESRRDWLSRATYRRYEHCQATQNALPLPIALFSPCRARFLSPSLLTHPAHSVTLNRTPVLRSNANG